MRALMTWDQALENWLRQEVVPAFEALKADPTRGVPLDEVLVGLEEIHKKTIG